MSNQEVGIEYVRRHNIGRLGGEPFLYGICDLFELSQKAEHEPVFALSKDDLAHCRTLKDDACSYAWRPESRLSPSTIIGFRYVIIRDEIPDGGQPKVYLLDSI